MAVAGRDPGPLRAIGLVGGIGFELAVPALLCALVGYYLDKRWGSGPWLTLVGTLVGTAAGLLQLIRAVKRLDNGSDKASGS
jgi:F0F1-type ATP synthase assembly protein I